MSLKAGLRTVVACAVVALASWCQPSFAYTMELDPSGATDLESDGKVTFGESVQVECDVTLGSTLASSIDMTAGNRIGAVTEIEISSCEGGTISGSELPWTLEYVTSDGVLPNELEGIDANIEGMEITQRLFGGFVSCRYRGLWNVDIRVVNLILVIVNIDYSSGLALTKEGGSELCPREMRGRGKFDLSPPQDVVLV